MAPDAGTPNPPGASPTPRPERGERVSLITLFVIALVLMAVLIAPFATPLYLAAVLAGVLHPAISPMSRGMHVRPGFAAALLTFGTLVVVVLPLGWLATVLVQEGIRAIMATRELLATHSVGELLARLPESLQGVASWVRPRIEASLPQLDEIITPILKTLAGRLPGWLARTSGFLGEALLMLLALYALLTDGSRLVRWLASVSPLPPGRLEALLADFRRIATAVLASTLVVALAQSVATIIGLAMVRAPQPLFFGFVAFLIAFIPILSPALVSFGMAVALLAQGRWVAAMVLAAWAAGVVMTVDNFVRPLVLRRGIQLHPMVLLFAVLGGVVAFGPIGIIAGPMVLSFFLAMVEMTRQEFAPAGMPSKPTGADEAGC